MSVTPVDCFFTVNKEFPACRTACGIRLLAGTFSDNLYRRFCSQRTDAFSALEVSRRCAIQIDFLLTYLLTYLLTTDGYD